jgi:hypothetical protein
MTPKIAQNQNLKPPNNQKPSYHSSNFPLHPPLSIPLDSFHFPLHLPNPPLPKLISIFTSTPISFARFCFTFWFSPTRSLTLISLSKSFSAHHLAHGWPLYVTLILPSEELRLLSRWEESWSSENKL